jgi:D-alanine-D-alanine ligase
MKKIAIICGGDSGEYEISMKSARVVQKHLNRSKYEGYLVEIKGKDWFYKDENGEKHHIDKNDFSLALDSGKLKFDGVFNAIHGTPGEDGKIQGYFDLLHMPYTCCDQDTSALTFNKHLCNKFVSSFGVQVADSLTFFKGETVDLDQVIEKLGLPVFVKPARSGSSVGISKVSDRIQFPEAVGKAFAEDSQVLVERFIRGRELTCGMINKGEELIVFPLTEIISKKEFFDFEAKYDNSLADEITPADVDLDVEQDVKTLSAFLFKQLGCKGFVRFDYILSEEGLYFIEVNTIPGMTEESILPQMAADYGMSLTTLFGIALENIFITKT